MKKLVYEDISLKTHFAYAIYKYGDSLSEMKYLVYETNQDGQTTCIAKYESYDDARELVKNKCK